jgi:hypothetical protein
VHACIWKVSNFVEYSSWFCQQKGQPAGSGKG